MRANDPSSTHAGSLYGTGDAGASARARKPSWMRQEQERATSKSALIISSLFLVLLAAALLVGGHFAIDPMLKSAIDARGANGVGELVYTMPDGVFCRHMSFDNATSEIIEGSVQPCPSRVAVAHAHEVSKFPREVSKFRWRTN